MPALANPATAQTASQQQQTERTVTDVVPAPAEARANPNANFWLSPFTVIRTEQDSAPAKQVGDYLASLLRPSTGYALPVVSANRGPWPSISLALGHVDQRVGAEGCELFGGLRVFVIERMFYWVGEAG
jgi:hexosaminidase